MSDLRVVIFDCDGTLVDSSVVICRAMKRAFVNQGLPTPDDAAIRHIVGLDLLVCMQRLAPALGHRQLYALAEAFKHEVMEDRKVGLDSTPLYPGCLEALDWLSHQGNVLLSVATGKPRMGLNHTFEQHNIGDYFYATQTADDAPGKPHPGMIENVMRATGALPDQILMVGDTTYDVEMGINAGCRSLGVGWGYHAATALQDAGALAVASGFDELRAMISEAWAE